MLVQELLSPSSIAVVGASNDAAKPGGKVLQNLMDAGFTGSLHAVNPKASSVQGVSTVASVADLPNVDLAILAIPARLCPEAVDLLAREKGTRGFIVLSAGFSEEGPDGAELERQMVASVERVGGSLIGPNCIGVLLPGYAGVFTTPIPRLDPGGCDFVSGSGATAVFIMEAGIPRGLQFRSVFSVGNGAQIGVEEVLSHLDDSFDPKTSSRVKLLYIESITKPDMFLRHASSLVRKGCRLAAIKAGSSAAGSRAASSHTGALAGSDAGVDALLRKAGIVRCYGREELVTVASVLLHPEFTGDKLAIVTHAGGPGVMLTDALSAEGLSVPPIQGDAADRLKSRLYPGSSVGNPIDFLATGTAEQLRDILETCDREFNDIDAVAVIFGSPGLFDVSAVYAALDRHIKTAEKPVFPVLPSVVNAREAIEEFIAGGRIAFFDEVSLARAVGLIRRTPPPPPLEGALPELDRNAIRAIVDAAEPGYLSPTETTAMLDAAGITRVPERVVDSASAARAVADEMGYPLVLKVVGPVHKSDVGGVVLGVMDPGTVEREAQRLLELDQAVGVLVQPMRSGIELFAGVIREDKFGHLVMAGLGGVFVEVFRDTITLLAPFDAVEAGDALSRLQAYPILTGVRGSTGIALERYVDVLVRLAALADAAPEIAELDLNPLLGSPDEIIAVDARIRIG